MEQKAPMNFQKALREFDGDKEFLIEILHDFLKQVKSQIEPIRQAISRGDAETVRREAHSIKGGAANLGANDLSMKAFELEDIGKSGILEGSAESLQKLEKELMRLENYAKNQQAG